MKVLIAEDIDFVREQLTQVLSAIKGVNVVWNGPITLESIDVSRELHPDVVILNVSVTQALLNDLIFDVVGEVKADTPTSYVIVLGDHYDAQIDKDFEAAIQRSEADLYLSRSYELIRLPRLIQTMLEMYGRGSFT